MPRQGVGAGVPGVGVVVGEQAGPHADDVAGGGDGGVRLVRPHVDVVLAPAGGVVVVHGAVDDGDQDGVGGPADAHRRGAQAGFDVRVAIAVALVLGAPVHQGGQVAGAVVDLEHEAGAGVDDVGPPVVAVSEGVSRRVGGGEQRAADRGATAEDESAGGGSEQDIAAGETPATVCGHGGSVHVRGAEGAVVRQAVAQGTSAGDCPQGDGPGPLRVGKGGVRLAARRAVHGGTGTPGRLSGSR